MACIKISFMCFHDFNDANKSREQIVFLINYWYDNADVKILMSRQKYIAIQTIFVVIICWPAILKRMFLVHRLKVYYKVTLETFLFNTKPSKWFFIYFFITEKKKTREKWQQNRLPLDKKHFLISYLRSLKNYKKHMKTAEYKFS